MRFALVTASGRMRLAAIRGIAEGIEVKPKLTAPPESAASAGPALLNGTWGSWPCGSGA